MKKSKTAIIGWVLSAPVAGLLTFSAIVKLFDIEGKEESFAEMGWTVERMVPIGIVELAVVALFLIPRTAFVGAILLAAYLGGAVATHARIGDPTFVVPVVLGVVGWIALGLRQPGVFKLALGKGK